MPGPWVMNRFFWLCVLAAWCAGTRAAEPIDVASYLPADTAVYVGWTPWVDKDAPEFKRQCELIEGVLKLASEKGDVAQSDVTRELVGMLTLLPTASGGLGVFDVGLGDEGLDVQAAVVLAGADAGRLSAAIDTLISKIGLTAEAHRIKDVPVQCSLIPDMSLSLVWGAYRDCFLLALGDVAAAKVIDCLAGRAEALTTTAEYRFDQDKLGAGPADASLCVYVNVPRVLERARVLAAELGSPLPPVAERLLEELGVTSVRSKVLRVARRGSALELRAFAHVDGPWRGLLKIWDQQPLGQADLAIVPQDAYWAYVTNLDLGALWTEALRIVEEVAPDALPSVQGALAAMRGLLGFSVTDDLLPAFGDTWALFDAPGHGGLLLTGAVLVVDVADREKLEAILQRCMQMLTPLAAQNDVALTVRQTVHGPHTVHYVLLGGVPSPVAPAWGFVGGRCVIGLFPQTVAAAMRAVDPGTRGPTILDHPAVKAARVGWPTEIQSFRYCDARYLARLLYPLVNAFRTLSVSVTAKAGAEIDLAAMPPVDEAIANVTSCVGVTGRDADGILIVGAGGVLVSGLGATDLLRAGALYLATSDARAAEAATNASGRRLTLIGHACLVYAARHDGRFPDALSMLARDGLLDDETLAVPGARGGDVAYAYIAGQTMDADRRNVLAYEPRERGGAHGVLFLDGHVARLPRSELAAAVRATYERLGREAEIPAAFRP